MTNNLSHQQIARGLYDYYIGCGITKEDSIEKLTYVLLLGITNTSGDTLKVVTEIINELLEEG